jgi:UTP---glucose-1-phosphate uridylyltransferase
MPLEQEIVKEQDQREIEELKRKISDANNLRHCLATCSTLDEKVSFLSSLDETAKFLPRVPYIGKWLDSADVKSRFSLLILLALGQGPFIFVGGEALQDREGKLQSLSSIVWSLEEFYKSIGGAVGYHVRVLELMYESLASVTEDDIEEVRYLPPPVWDIRHSSKENDELFFFGLQAMEQIGEVYVVGGAGDRLSLVDEKTGRPLPAARLRFLGKTLLNLLVRDLEAREYLFYKLFGKTQETPIILMTSEEKMNDHEIGAILEDAGYFNRQKSNFLRVVQPLTPVISIDGVWASTHPLELYLKPGGHGVIWKLSKDGGAFRWLEEKGRSSIIIRQINNPLAGLDVGLLALAGFGVRFNMSFGFASCPTRNGAQEGVNVLKESPEGLCITNLEYTELMKGSHRTLKLENFCANTNILFARLHSLEKAIERNPLPGMIVNMKFAIPSLRSGVIENIRGARLELTMQNIADAIEAKHTFVLLNDRQKTISVTKKSHHPGEKIADTPEGAFFDLLQTARKLLVEHLAFEVPEMPTHEEYLNDGPSFIFLYHPALGPLYSIIKQKIQKGRFARCAELQLECAEVKIEDLDLDGSLLIEAERVTKKADEKGVFQFSSEVGSVILRNVKVKNRGIEKGKNCYWKNEISRKEALEIYLEGNSEFVAENVTIAGGNKVKVRSGYRVRALQDGNNVHFVEEPLGGKKLAFRYERLPSNQFLAIAQSRDLH